MLKLATTTLYSFVETWTLRQQLQLRYCIYLPYEPQGRRTLVLCISHVSHQSSQSSHERPCVLRPFIHESESPQWPTHLDSDTLQEDSCSAVLSKRPWNQPFESRVDSSSGPCTAAHACTVQRPCADALQQAASWPCSPPSHQPPANQHSNSSVAPRSGHGATRTTRAGRSRRVD